MSVGGILNEFDGLDLLVQFEDASLDDAELLASSLQGRLNAVLALHGEGLATASLSVGEDRPVVALHSLLQQGLTSMTLDTRLPMPSPL